MISFDFSWHVNCYVVGDWNNLLSQIMVAGHRLHIPGAGDAVLAGLRYRLVPPGTCLL